MSQTQLIDLEGEPGHFTARVGVQPRFIDLSKCTSCGECAKVCPVTLPNEYDEGLSTKKAAFKQYAQAIPGAFAIQKTDKAPCRLACPAGLNVQGYVQMVKQGKYKEALEIIMEELPLPGVLGRICPHGCEDACRRCEVDEPVAIRELKRLAADRFDPRKIKIDCEPARKEKVAIIGSGPAGLSAAYHLARKGIKSTIFEALPEAGGMLRVGIPDHRLPRAVLDQEIEVITNLGVEIKTNTPLGPDLTVDDLLADGYKAVYLAMGAHKGIELGIPGEKAEGVRQGVDFLREVNLTGKAEVGRNVISSAAAMWPLMFRGPRFVSGPNPLPFFIAEAGTKCRPGKKRFGGRRRRGQDRLSFGAPGGACPGGQGGRPSVHQHGTD